LQSLSERGNFACGLLLGFQLGVVLGLDQLEHLSPPPPRDCKHPHTTHVCDNWVHTSIIALSCVRAFSLPSLSSSISRSLRASSVSSLSTSCRTLPKGPSESKERCACPMPVR